MMVTRIGVSSNFQLCPVRFLPFEENDTVIFQSDCFTSLIKPIKPTKIRYGIVDVFHNGVVYSY